MHFLITAGGTREYVDPVRFISNASSGRMGDALARAALREGHEVTFVTAPTSLKPPAGGNVILVESAAEMFAAVKEHFHRCDCLIMAAAVSDYTVARRAKTKRKKGDAPLTIRLKPTADIIRWAGVQKCSHQVVVGFALEDRAVIRRAKKKMADKRMDMIVANTPAAIGEDRSTVDILTADGQRISLTDASKTVTAACIIRMACDLAKRRP